MTCWVFKPGFHVYTNRGTVGHKEIYRPVIVAHSAFGPGAQGMDHNSDLIDIPFAIREGRYSARSVAV